MSLWLLWGSAVGAQGLDALPSLVGPGEDQGCTVAQPVGDLDGDGLGDLVVGCAYDDTAGHEAGAAYVVLDVANLQPYTLITDIGRAYTGEEPQDHAGFSVAALGDFDGDGNDDAAVGAPDASTDLPVVGKVYLLLGRSHGGGSLAGTETLRGGDEWGRIGTRLFGPQDLDDDGFGDLLIGSPYATPGGNVAAGWLAVVRGGPDAPSAQVVTIDVQPGETTTTADAGWVHELSGTFFGRAAAALPDSTGDGLPELLVAAPGLTKVPGSDGGDHADGDHPTGTVYAFASREPAAVLDQPVASVDDAMGVIGGDTAGDALAWTLVAGPGQSAVLGAPEALDNAGLVTLISTLSGIGLLGDRAEATLSGDTPGALLGWSLAASDGELVADNDLWIGEPGWDSGTGRLLAVAPGTGDALASDRAVAVLPGCWPGGELGHHVGRGTVDPTGATADWYAVTAPLASIHEPLDGLVVVLDRAHIAQGLGGACGDGDTGSPAEADVDGDGWSADLDCDDGAAWRNPDMPEVCGDSVDDDCDGEIDEACGPVTGVDRRCDCSSGGPAGLLPTLLALGLATRRRRTAPVLAPSPPTDTALPVRWRATLPLVLLALPSAAQGQTLDDLATAWLWGSAASEFLHGPVLTGDFDGDGTLELAVANFQGTAYAYAAGEVQLLPASDAVGPVDLLSAPVQLVGDEEHEYFGVAVARVPGDVDGLWVGADRTGLTNRVEGTAALFLEPMSTEGMRRADEADLILSGDSVWDAFGRTLAVGDFDGDGLPDTAIGAPQRDGPAQESPGRVWLFHGSTGPIFGAQLASAVSTGELDGGSPEAFLGWRLLMPGDLDGDGRDDLVVGSLGETPAKAGNLAVFTDLDPAGGLVGSASGTWAGVAAGDQAGQGLAGHDWDGDGVQEILVGAPYHAQARGRVWLLDGAPSGVVSLDDAATVTLDGEVGDQLGASAAAGPLLLLGAPGIDELLALTHTGAESLRLDGLAGLGRGVHWIDDLDGDGVAEAVAVAPTAEHTRTDQGVAVVLDGAGLLEGASTVTSDLDLDLDGSPAGEDCDDGDPRRSPLETELCRNDLDDDCDRIVDEDSCEQGGCDSAGGLPSIVLGLSGLALVVLRRRGRWLALGLVAGCGASDPVSLELDPGPLSGEVPVSLSGTADTLILYLDGEPVASGVTSPLTWTWDTTTSEDGLHLVRGAGFTEDQAPAEDWLQVQVDQSLADAAPPQVSFLSPLDGQAYPRDSDVFISLYVTDDVCLDDVRVYRSGDSEHSHGLDDLLAVLPAEGPWELYWDDAAAGTWTLEAQALDCVGLTGSATVTIEVTDTAPVTCTLVEPAEGQEVSGELDIKVAASSDAGITQVSVSEGGSTIGTDTESPWGVTWDAGTSPREVVLAATCTAADGAQATDTITVQVVEEASSEFEATLTRPLDGDTVSGGVSIKAAVGGGEGPASVWFYVDDTLLTEDTESPWETAWDSAEWPNGTATLSIVGVEAVTGVEVGDSIEVTVEN